MHGILTGPMTRAGLIPPIATVVMVMVPLFHRTATDLVGPMTSFRVGTVIMLLALCCLVRFWPEWERVRANGDARTPHAGLAIAVCLVGVILVWLAQALLPVVFAGRLDPERGDMLVVVDAGIREWLAGRMPYRLYYLPKEAPLPYGPALWGPYVPAVALHFDLRLISLLGILASIGTCLLIGTQGLFHRLWIPAVSALVPALVLAGHADVWAFYPIAHTPVYWPLLVLFALLITLRQWMWAAAVLGGLISARSTMVSLVPVFLMATHVTGLRAWRPLLLIGLCALIPLVPFVVQDPGAIVYAFIGSYERVMKGVVWAQTNWAHRTYGLTSVLLNFELGRYVQPAQVLSLTVVYALAWLGIRARQAPAPWLVASLMVFTMTSLWPVLYTYFDVWILAVGFLSAVVFRATVPSARVVSRSMSWLAIVALVSVVSVLAVGAYSTGRRYVIDVGSPASVSFTGGGFGGDESVVEDDRTLVWVTGRTARVRLPRAGWGAATLELHLKPFADTTSVPTLLVAKLNGQHIGGATLKNGWQVLSVPTHRRHWLYGFNVLDLSVEFPANAPAETDRTIGLDKVVIR